MPYVITLAENSTVRQKIGAKLSQSKWSMKYRLAKLDRVEKEGN